MSVHVIEDRLAEYKCETIQDQENALAEIYQEIVLSALSRTDFYKYAAFQGGTCLRILYGLNRFSEDLDFVLKSPNSHFEWQEYLNNIVLEFKSYGIHIEVKDRSINQNVVKKAFIKDSSIGQVLSLQHKRDQGKKIQIKLEVDTTPPSESTYENKYLLFPFSFAVVCQDLPSLFASKSHALMCREYVKGRDWYDFIWYVRKKVRPNYKLLSSAINQMGPWQNKNVVVDKKWYVSKMSEKMHLIKWEDAKQDVSRFLKVSDQEGLKVWSQDFFLELLEAISE